MRPASSSSPQARRYLTRLGRHDVPPRVSLDNVLNHRYGEYR